MDANDTCAICGYGGLATNDGNDVCLEKRGNQPGFWQGLLIVFFSPIRKAIGFHSFTLGHLTFFYMKRSMTLFFPSIGIR